MSFKGLFVTRRNTFIYGSTLVDNGSRGLSMIRLTGSYIEVVNVKVFNNTFTDGLFHIIENFYFNRVLIESLIAINNSALKRCAGSILLDSNSRDRNVILKLSLFINNAALTQNGAGIHIFHTNLFIFLNIT